MLRKPCPSTAKASLAALTGALALAPSAMAQQTRIDPQYIAPEAGVAAEVTGAGQHALVDFGGQGDTQPAAGTALTGSADAMPQMDGGGDNGESPRSAPGRRRRSRDADESGDDVTRGGRSLQIVPYLEAQQVFDTQLSPSGGDTLTYSVLAAGIEAGARTNGYRGSLSLRYERRFGWGKATSYDNLSGLARGAVAIVPHALHFEAAGYANRIHVSDQGATTGDIGAGDSLAQVYSVMAGPSLATDVGALEVKGHYRIGYSHVGTPANIAPAPGQSRADLFDHATVQDAKLRIDAQPGDVAPVGFAVEAGHMREAISNLDQRVRDSHVRGDVTVPIADHAALVGGVGYEWVDVSSRDALRDVNGDPVLSAKGRIITDTASPRVIAFETEGLIWDAGVVWRPSRRTAFEAHVGQRYGDIGGYGSFSYRPTRHSSFNVTVYDNMASFGGVMTSALGDMPTDFTAVRDPLSGNVGGCVNSSSTGSCLAGSLSTVRSAVFRGRGVNAAYNWSWNRWSAGFGVGYDRRRYVTAPGTALAALNGKVESDIWTTARVDLQLDPQSSIGGQFDTTWYRSNVVANGDLNAIRAAAVYQHHFTRNLSGSAALGIDGINRKAIEDAWRMSGQVGMRYAF